MSERTFKVYAVLGYMLIAFLLFSLWHVKDEIGRACGIGSGSIANGTFATINKDTYVCSRGELIRVIIVPIPHPPIEE